VRRRESVVVPTTAKQKKTPKINPDTNTSGQVSGLNMGTPKQASGLTNKELAGQGPPY
jgi:hypothetical protein